MVKTEEITQMNIQIISSRGKKRSLYPFEKIVQINTDGIIIRDIISQQAYFIPQKRFEIIKETK